MRICDCRPRVSFARVRGPRLLHRLLARTAEPLLPAQVAAVFEHVAGVRVQRPVAALARSLGGPRHLDETVVERQAVPDGVLPALLVLPVVRKQVHDELVDLAERAHAARRVLDGERDERDVGVGRLGVSVVAPAVGPVDHGRSGFAAAAGRRRRFRRRDAVGDVEGRSQRCDTADVRWMRIVVCDMAHSAVHARRRLGNLHKAMHAHKITKLNKLINLIRLSQTRALRDNGFKRKKLRANCMCVNAILVCAGKLAVYARPVIKRKKNN